MAHLAFLRHPVRTGGMAIVATAVLLPIAIIIYQSFLDGPFFLPNTKPSLAAYGYVLGDPEFHSALLNSLLIAAAMVAIAVPLGSILAFLMVRTDLPGRQWIEPWLLSPIFVSSIILAFGYVVCVGPVGFLSLWVKDLIGFTPWTLYSFQSLILIAGLSHVPHVYLYVSAALRSVNPEVEEAARVTGAGFWRAALTVSLPLVRPSIVFSATLLFLLGMEVFGLVLVLGDQADINVLTTYLYKLANLFSRPAYHLMAVVALAMAAVTLPLVFVQRYLLRSSELYVTVQGKGLSPRRLPLGRWRWVAFAGVMLWLLFTVVLPLTGVVLRAFVSHWGVGASLPEALTLNNVRSVLELPNLSRGVTNTILIATIGGGLAVGVYTAVALLAHRWRGAGPVVLDFLLMIPRALPGLVAGLAFLWIFLFIPLLTPIRSTLASIWIAYTIVWLAYGVRLISASLMQIAPELEQSARVAGAGQARACIDVTLPLLRFGMLTSCILIFITFCREYSSGVYLLSPSTEMIGPMIVSMLAGGGLDLVAALCLINVLLIAVGVLTALKLGVRLNV